MPVGARPVTASPLNPKGATYGCLVDLITSSPDAYEVGLSSRILRGAPLPRL